MRALLQRRGPLCCRAVRALPLVLVAFLTLLAASCSGPAASDAAVCQDWIRRICAAPRCELATSALGVDEACEQTLLARSGCGADDFAFSAVTRTRFLNCRLALLRGGRDEPVAPDCIDVAESFERCQD